MNAGELFGKVLWDTIVKEDWQKWDENPCVWVIEFEQCDALSESEEPQMIYKGKRYRVLSDSLDFFKQVEIVIPIESEVVSAFCINELLYSGDKDISDYNYDEYNPLADNKPEEIESQES